MRTKRRRAVSEPLSREAAGAATSGPRFFAFAVPGLASLLAAELESIHGVHVQDTGFDGRADVVLFTAESASLRQVLSVRLAEDIFIEVGRTLRSAGDRAEWIAGRLWRPERVGRALTTRGQLVGPVSDRGSFRVIARVLQERSFLRTALRRQMTDAIQRQQPRWRLADPSNLEVWVVEYQPGKILAGLRASDARMRKHDGRAAERAGALRPTVAAAMVRLAGEADGLLLDPCCGAGTILAEALGAGWRVQGVDVDPEAVEMARRNVPKALVDAGDARRLKFRDGTVDACVSNLPFGQQYEIQGGTENWLRIVLGEIRRVTRPGSRVVLLVPSIPQSVVPRELQLTHRVPIRLLGMKATLWAYDRR